MELHLLAPASRATLSLLRSPTLVGTGSFISSARWLRWRLWCATRPFAWSEKAFSASRNGTAKAIQHGLHDDVWMSLVESERHPRLERHSCTSRGLTIIYRAFLIRLWSHTSTSEFAQQFAAFEVSLRCFVARTIMGYTGTDFCHSPAAIRTYLR